MKIAVGALAAGAGFGAATSLVNALCAVGAVIGLPGVKGLLAALTVPVGAAVQMVVQPSRPHPTSTPATVLAEIIVWAAAVLGACWAVHRFRAARRAVV